MTSLYSFRHKTEQGEAPCFVFDKMLDPEFCDNLIKETKDKVITAEHQHEGELITSKDKTRNSNVYWFANPDLTSVLRSCVDTVNYETGWKYDIVDQEAFQFTKYAKGQHYSWHTDGHGCHQSARMSAALHNNNTLLYTRQTNLLGTVRKISVSALLNGDYKGGELQFRTLGHDGELITSTIECKQGAVVVFPSYIHHRVAPITRGIRYSVVAWYGGPPFK